jgi:hypothetical protein
MDLFKNSLFLAESGLPRVKMEPGRQPIRIGIVLLIIAWIGEQHASPFQTTHH